MDRTFNFFKNKLKKQNLGPRNTSNSNSSKASNPKPIQKSKPVVLKPSALTKKQLQIRQAIQYRYAKSKIKVYRFGRVSQGAQRERNSSNSADMAEYKHLKNKQIFDLKGYHQRQNTLHSSANSSQERKRFNLRIKMRDSTSGILKTQGNQVAERSPFIANLMKNITPNKFTKKGDQWKFISIQLKEDNSKTRKTQVKISSHRSYNVKSNGQKQKSNSAVGKYLQNSKKFKETNKMPKSRLQY